MFKFLKVLFKFIFISALIFELLLGLVSCSSFSKYGSFKLRKFKEVSLENGMKIIYIEDSRLPRISLSLMLKTGSIFDPQNKEGLNNVVAELLDKGSKSKNANQIAEQFELIGSSFNSDSDYDYTLFKSSSLSQQKDKLLNLFYEVITTPTLNDKEFYRLKKHLIAKLRQESNSAFNYANFLINHFLYQNHPYGHNDKGSVNSLRTIKRRDIILHYINYYRPNNAILVVAGNFDTEFTKNLENKFSKWEKREIDYNQESLTKIDFLENKFILVHKNGLQQAQIRLAHKGLKRDNPDYLSIKIANSILGNHFLSRLNQHIREKLGLTYSIYSYFDFNKYGGDFIISTFTRNEMVGKTLEETLKVFNDFYQQGISKEELELVKNYFQGQFPKVIETPENFAYNLLYLKLNHVSISYLENYLKNLNQLTVDHINRVIKNYFHPKELTILIHGNKNKITKQLTKYTDIKVIPYNKIEL